MEKNILIIYGNEVENSILMKISSMIACNCYAYIKGDGALERQVQIYPLLQNFIVVTTLVECIDILKETSLNFNTSGLKTSLIEKVTHDQFKEVIYKEMNKLKKISVADNVQLFDELNGIQF